MINWKSYINFVIDIIIFYIYYIILLYDNIIIKTIYIKFKL